MIPVLEESDFRYPKILFLIASENHYLLLIKVLNTKKLFFYWIQKTRKKQFTYIENLNIFVANVFVDVAAPNRDSTDFIADGNDASVLRRVNGHRKDSARSDLDNAVFLKNLTNLNFRRSHIYDYFLCLQYIFSWVPWTDII